MKLILIAGIVMIAVFVVEMFLSMCDDTSEARHEH
jgi:hypothetical protein